MNIEVINGLLGAGKTTFLLNLLEQKPKDEKVAVLVNEFGEIGIDGDILGGQGADVVELPNGCICCSLNADLRNQIRIIAETYNPDRLIIEPTGVATVKNLLGILRSLSLEKYIDDIKIIVVLDAATFEEFLAQNRGFIETQVQMAGEIIINKCDKAEPQVINKIITFIENANSTGQIRLTSFGRVLDKDKKHCHQDDCCKESHTHHHQGGPEEGHTRHHYEGAPEEGHTHFHHGDSHNEDEGHHYHESPLKNYEQFSCAAGGIFEQDQLRKFFKGLKKGDFGVVDRAKGIFRISGHKWVRIDLASHEINESALDREFETSKVMIVGAGLRQDLLKDKFIKCLASS